MANPNARLKVSTLLNNRAPNPGSDDAISSPISVLVFNANDPTGASGLSGDALSIASVGAHAVTIVTGSYKRDTFEIVGHFAFDDEAIGDQAETILGDVSCSAIKAGFVGSPDALRVVAQVASDFPDLPLIAYMPDLSWWEEIDIENYLDAFEGLLMPEISVLVGNYNTLSRWLLPEWGASRPPGARDIAQAAASHGTEYVLVTGLPSQAGHIANTLASAQEILLTVSFERVEASFLAAGDTLSAALAGLMATGMDLISASGEALNYMDASLLAGFAVGMGKAAPDRLFWAGTDDAESPQEDLLTLPNHDTRH